MLHYTTLHTLLHVQTFSSAHSFQTQPIVSEFHFAISDWGERVGSSPFGSDRPILHTLASWLCCVENSLWNLFEHLFIYLFIHSFIHSTLTPIHIIIDSLIPFFFTLTERRVSTETPMYTQASSRFHRTVHQKKATTIDTENRSNTPTLPPTYSIYNGLH
jgi:hypothetical protein